MVAPPPTSGFVQPHRHSGPAPHRGGERDQSVALGLAAAKGRPPARATAPMTGRRHRPDRLRHVRRPITPSHSTANDDPGPVSACITGVGLRRAAGVHRLRLRPWRWAAKFLASGSARRALVVGARDLLAHPRLVDRTHLRALRRRSAGESFLEAHGGRRQQRRPRRPDDPAAALDGRATRTSLYVSGGPGAPRENTTGHLRMEGPRGLPLRRWAMVTDVVEAALRGHPGHRAPKTLDWFVPPPVRKQAPFHRPPPPTSSASPRRRWLITVGSPREHLGGVDPAQRSTWP